MTSVANLVDKIMAYEGGSMNTVEVIEFFQELVDTGLAWSLQGSYARTAHELIDAGYVSPATEIDLGKVDCE
jgi:hypothetical protein